VWITGLLDRAEEMLEPRAWDTASMVSWEMCRRQHHRGRTCLTLLRSLRICRRTRDPYRKIAFCHRPTKTPIVTDAVVFIPSDTVSDIFATNCRSNLLASYGPSCSISTSTSRTDATMTTTGGDGRRVRAGSVIKANHYIEQNHWPRYNFCTDHER
jgi:hypothetical protein